MNQAVVITELNVFKRHSTPSLLETFLPTSFQIDRYFTLILFSIGLIGNILSTIVWWYPRLRFMESTVLTFIFLSIVDLVQLILVMILDMQKVWSVSIFFNDVLCKMFTLLSNAIPMLSTLLLLTVSIQHYFTLKKNPNYQYYKSKKWSYLIVSLLTLVSTLISIPDGYFSFLDFTLHQINECHFPIDILLVKEYTIYYWIVKFFLLSASIVALSFLSIMVLHKRNYNENKGDFLHKTDCTNQDSKFCSCNDINNVEKISSLTTVVAVLGFYEVFTIIPQIIMKSLAPLNNYGEPRMTDFEVKNDPIWERHFNMESANILFDEIHLSIYSFKFLIYFFFNRDFRESFGEIFGMKFLCGKPKLKLNRNLQRQNSRDLTNKEKPKSTSFYLQRSHNKNPIKNQDESTLIENVYKPKHYHNKGLQTKINENVKQIKRNNKKQHSQIFDIHSIPKLYCCPKHYEKYIQNQKQYRNEKEFQLQNKNIAPDTKFHNVCSEFEYKSVESLNESEDSSKIFYVEKCQCTSSESDLSQEPCIMKVKNPGNHFHQV